MPGKPYGYRKDAINNKQQPILNISMDRAGPGRPVDHEAMEIYKYLDVPELESEYIVVVRCLHHHESILKTLESIQSSEPRAMIWVYSGSGGEAGRQAMDSLEAAPRVRLIRMRNPWNWTSTTNVILNDLYWAYNGDETQGGGYSKLKGWAIVDNGALFFERRWMDSILPGKLSAPTGADGTSHTYLWIGDRVPLEVCGQMDEMFVGNKQGRHHMDKLREQGLLGVSSINCKSKWYAGYQPESIVDLGFVSRKRVFRPFESRKSLK